MMFWRVLLLTLAVSSSSFAQELMTIPPGPDRLQPLRLKEPAPYDGILFDNDTALRWGNWLKQYQLRLKIDVQAEKQKCQVKLETATKVDALKEETHRALQDDLKKRVLKLEEQNIKLEDELRNQPWYETRTFGVVAGVVGSVAVFGLSVWAVDTLRR